MSFYQRFGKRAFDFVLASLTLIVVSPVLLVAALLVRIKLGTPVIFRQRRPGLHGRVFTIFKFRTMTDAKDHGGRLLSDDLRLTGFGRVLRSTSIDELPELANVVRGEMSLVGPRPLLVRYLPYFTEEEKIRFSVRPGITGNAQVSGRNDLSWDARLKRDVEYVRNMSLMTDLKILFGTVACVLHRKGYQEHPNAIMLDFDAERQQRSEVNR